ncbi:hypothetical protein [Streptomyces sp. YIM 132580]|uniref:hypothetical protein n=1 Tax=Streptomyces sp. YIM 132580 TaxID=2691958 RepID=UPI001F21C3C6|nr:hypothetical protein [Streptomyces sp. YIM 132580]
MFSLRGGDAPTEAERRLLAEPVAGWGGKYPDVRLDHEVVTGSPVEALADAAGHAVAVVVGRRGRGGSTGSARTPSSTGCCTGPLPGDHGPRAGTGMTGPSHGGLITDTST